jgi:hypothetical protein
MDVDLLERELYAMNKAADDFVEIPRWVRLMNDGLWYGGRRPSRRIAYVLEAILMGCAILFFAASFFVNSDFMTITFRLAALFNLVCGCLLSVASRVIDTYKLWPIDGATSELRQLHRTWRSRVVEYSFAFSVALLLRAPAHDGHDSGVMADSHSGGVTDTVPIR